MKNKSHSLRLGEVVFGSTVIAVFAPPGSDGGQWVVGHDPKSSDTYHVFFFDAVSGKKSDYTPCFGSLASAFALFAIRAIDEESPDEGSALSAIARARSFMKEQLKMRG